MTPMPHIQELDPRNLAIGQVVGLNICSLSVSCGAEPVVTLYVTGQMHLINRFVRAARSMAYAQTSWWSQAQRLQVTLRPELPRDPRPLSIAIEFLNDVSELMAPRPSLTETPPAETAKTTQPRQRSREHPDFRRQLQQRRHMPV